MSHAIRAPEYFPRLALLALIDAADQAVLADTFQYSRQSYQNRMQVRTPHGAHWLSVPLVGGQHGTPICDVRIDDRTRWQRKQWKTLRYNYESSPFFGYFERDLRPLFETAWDTLGPLTCQTVEVLARCLGITTPLVRASALPGAPARLPALHQAVGAPDLVALSDTCIPDQQQVASTICLPFTAPVYQQNFAGFVPNLSVLDLLCNHGPAALGLLRRGLQQESTAPVAR